MVESAMPDPGYPLKVAILALPEATASTVYGMYDLFASTGRDWETIVNGEPGPAVFEPYTVSTDGQRFQASAGFSKKRQGDGGWFHEVRTAPTQAT